MWEIPTVTTTNADSRKRVVLPPAPQGEVYAVHDNQDGSFTLTVIRPAIPPSPKSRLAKEAGYTVVVPSQAINESAIKELLADFP